MSPNIVVKNKIKEKEFNNKEFKKIQKELTNIRKFIKKNFLFVGDQLPKKAREIYYDNKKNKNIYGTATFDEKLELEEEGIDLVGIPWIDNKEN